MGQQQQRPFVADPNEWEVIGDDDLEVVPDEPPAKTPTWSERLGLNQPTTSPMVGFMRGAGSGVVDLAQGAVSNVMGQLNGKLDADNALRGSAGLPQTATAPRVERPATLAGGVGSALPIVAEMAMPTGVAVKAGMEVLPSATRAGAKFEQVMGAARNIPIETKGVGDAALRINQLAERGGSMPMAVRKILQRMTDPQKAAMTYEEARDFASNISRLSADEAQRLTPVVRREVANLAAELNKANAEAAKLAGKGAEYKAAMREYANAMKMRDALDAALKHSKKAALGAAGLGGAYYMFGGKD